MKKVLIVASLSLFVLASCKKDYTCDCTIGGQTTSSSIKDAKKKDAQDACDKLSTTAAIAGGSCTLK